MHLIDDGGRELDAEYRVEPDSGHLTLILESRNAGPKPRNRDYNPALTSLLRRLGALNATLLDGLVDSRETRRLGLPEADRRFIHAPIRTALEPDFDIHTADKRCAASSG